MANAADTQIRRRARVLGMSVRKVRGAELWVLIGSESRSNPRPAVEINSILDQIEEGVRQQDRLVAQVNECLDDGLFAIEDGYVVRAN